MKKPGSNGKLFRWKSINSNSNNFQIGLFSLELGKQRADIFTRTVKLFWEAKGKVITTAVNFEKKFPGIFFSRNFPGKMYREFYFEKWDFSNKKVWDSREKYFENWDFSK